ncbi:hypothetical protein F5B19DRAFT_478064 [Rostrohypoxylon terebratum]|nr:hypothetical protein F5B19DRAFT_478064 [Rostrohypoxylon terebratum]
MEQWQIALIVLAGCLVALIGSVCCAHFCSYDVPRLDQWVPMNNNRTPKSIREALELLERVTEKKSRRDLQAGSEDGECSICLARFYHSEARDSASTVVAGEVDLEAGDGVTRIQTATTEATTVEGTDRPMQPINDEVLKLNGCIHLFHARCLTTWFLQKQYRCPVCRTIYYHGAEHEAEDEDAVEFYPMPPPLPILGFW